MPTSSYFIKRYLPFLIFLTGGASWEAVTNMNVNNIFISYIKENEKSIKEFGTIVKVSSLCYRF